MAPKPKYVGRPGTIKEVQVRNFMCHELLTVPFSSQVSFVTGHNGSGKSAVLAAIVAGLGARANTTNRGSKMEDLIKTGKDTAVITIKIHNKGKDPAPFKHDAYGDTIVVERTLNRGRTHTYRLMSHNGSLVSKKSTDLTAIIDHFGIQVGNPVFLMNQDTSRSFLNSKTEKDFYKFFYKAAMLDDMEDLIKEHHNDTERAKELLDHKEKEMQPILESIAKWQKKQSECVRPDHVKEQIAEVELQIEIKQLQDVKVRYKAASAESKNAKLDLSKAEKLRMDLEEEIPRLKDKVEELTKKRDEISESMAKSQEEVDSSKPLVNQIRRERASKEGDLTQIENELTAKKKTLKEYEERLRKAKEESDAFQQEEKRAKLENSVSSAQNKVASARSERESALAAKPGLEQQVNGAKEDLRIATDDYMGSKRELTELTTRITGLESAARDANPLKRLGDLAVRQKQMVDDLVKRNALKGRIIGPLVCEMGIKDEAYSVAVERAVGAWLRSYLIEDERDRGTILNESKNQRIPAPVMDCVSGVGGKFMEQPVDFENEKARADEHPTVFDLLTFRHPHIRNVLTDATSIHQQVVMPSMEDARAHFRDGRSFANCRMVLDIEGNQHSRDQDGYMFMPNSSARGPPLLAKVNQQQINLLKGQMKDMDAEVKAKKKTMDELAGEKAILDRRLAALLKKIKDMEFEENKQLKMIENWNSELSELASVQQTFDEQVLEEEIQELKTAIKQMQDEWKEKRAELDSIKIKEEEQTSSFSLLKSQAVAAIESQQENEAAIEKTKQKLERAIADLEKYRSKEASLGPVVREKNAAAESLKQEAQAMLDALETKGFTDEQLRKQLKSIEHYEGRLAELQAQLASCSVDVEDSWEYCQHKLDDLLGTKGKIDEHIGVAKESVQYMEKNARIREGNYETSRAKATDIISAVFNRLMDERGFQGQILMDHEARSLKFDVTPHGGKQNNCANVKTLSGGERSFTMVCYLISLWALVEVPFRILDEFDVFMDMLNREHAMTRLIQYAKESGRQFIFLTPLAFSKEMVDDLREDPIVEIVQMPTASSRQQGAGQEE